MSPEEIKAFTHGLISGQSVWYVLTPVVGAVAAYFGAYQAEKGKNSATKEDIGEITKAVGEVNSEFNKKLEEFKTYHQLRMVAAERRIQAHQEAFSLWREFHQGYSQDDESWKTTYKKADKWYQENNFFLGKETRNNFYVALTGSDRFRICRQALDCKIRNGIDEKEYFELQSELLKIWECEVLKLLPLVFEEVELPSLAKPQPPA